MKNQITERLSLPPLGFSAVPGSVEMPALRVDGIEIPVELAIVRIPTEGPPVFTAYLRDLTERQNRPTNSD